MFVAVLSRHKSLASAQRAKRVWVQRQMVMDGALEARLRERGLDPHLYPRADEIHRIEEKNGQFLVVYDDPSL